MKEIDEKQPRPGFYIGAKVKGFKFDKVDNIVWNPGMEKYIGETGYVRDLDKNRVVVQFKDTVWVYPFKALMWSEENADN